MGNILEMFKFASRLASLREWREERVSSNGAQDEQRENANGEFREIRQDQDRDQDQLVHVAPQNDTSK